MHVLIGGASGFIGKHLSRYLRGRGHTVTGISRFEGDDCITWQQLHWDKDVPHNVDAVINLAGNRFMKWNSWSDKNELTTSNTTSISDWERSRIGTSQMCVSFVNQREKEGNPVRVYIQGSGFWYYHVNEETENNIWTEEDMGGHMDLISKLTLKWETSSKLPADSKTRSVIIRTGNVLSPEDGLLKHYLMRSKLYFGGPIRRGGANPLSWIHIEDQCGLIEHALMNENVDGTLNAVAPELVSHSDLAALVAKYTRKPNWYSFSPHRLGGVYGLERAKILLESAWIQPERTLQSGYHFKYISLASAVPDLYSKIERGYLIKNLIKDANRFLGGFEGNKANLQGQKKTVYERWIEITFLTCFFLIFCLPWFQ